MLHGGALVLFDGPLERLDVVRAAARAVHAHPMLLERPARLPIASSLLGWSPDPRFRVGKHVHVVELDDARDHATLARAVGLAWSRPLDPDRPPWQLVLFGDRTGGRAAVLLKAHAALVDAVGAARLAEILLGTPPESAASVSFASPPRDVAPSAGGALLQAISALAEQGARRSRALAGEVRTLLRPGVALARTRDVGRILESAGTLLSSPAPETPWNAPLGTERTVAWLAPSRDVLRGIADALGGDLHDVWLTIVADALGRYLRARGRSTIALTLLGYVPGEEHGYGSAVLSWAAMHATARLIALPVDEMSPAARHAAVHRSRHDPIAAARGAGIEQLARVAHELPAPLQSLLGSLCYQAANTILVEERALREGLTLGERRAMALVPLAMLPWNVGLALAAHETSDERLTVGITADATLVPRIGDVVRALQDAYVEAASAAGVPPIDPRLA